MIQSNNLAANLLESAWRTYRVFGFTLWSNYLFASRLVSGVGPPDLTFTCVASPPLTAWGEGAAPAYQSRYFTETGERMFYLYRLDGCDVLRFTRVADYYLFSQCILVHPFPPYEPLKIEGFLLGAALAFYLESVGIPALHASAIVWRDRAVAFLSNSGNGKSTLAATLVRAGCALLSDDIVPVQRLGGAFVGQPGVPQMRLWPSEAQHLLGHYEDLGRVSPETEKRWASVGAGEFGAFCPEARPLACLYVPERRDPVEFGADIEITPVPLREAVIELVRYSFTAFIMEALGWQAQRLKFFAELVRHVPVRRLRYPSGLEYLPRVREAIMKDLEGGRLDNGLT